MSAHAGDNRAHGESGIGAGFWVIALQAFQGVRKLWENTPERHQTLGDGVAVV